MPENSGNVTACGVNNVSAPDLFGFYTNEVQDMLSQDDSLLPFPHQLSSKDRGLHEVSRGKGSTKKTCQTKESNSVSSFSNGIGALLSDSKKERLKTLLRQSVFTLTREVDEMINPVLSICRIRSCLRCKENLLSSDASTHKADQTQHPHKKLKVSPACSDLESEHTHRTATGKELSNAVRNKCIQCNAARTPQWRPGPDGTKSLCNACGLRRAKNLKNGPSMNSYMEGGVESAELSQIDDDLRFILENDSTKVEELMERHSSETSAMLNHMELKLEELLNIVMTSCRAMTITDKQQLRKLIQNLPPRNLERVREIVGHNKQSEESTVHVDLDKVDNVSLWRLYFYVATTQQASRRSI